jgi:adenylate cyclase
VAKEIERKFLVNMDHPDLAPVLATTPIRIRQGYLKSDDKGVVRARVYGSQGYLTVKGPTLGITRDEFEYEIPAADANAMLEHMCGAIVSKSRYLIPFPGGYVFEIDVFDNIDLVIAEIELPREDSSYPNPAWLGQEVSHDPAYYNNAIAERIGTHLKAPPLQAPPN